MANSKNHPLAAALGAALLLAHLPAAAEEDVLTLTETARLLRVPGKVVAKMAQAGNIPARRIAGNWRFNRGAVMQWLQGERYAYPAEAPGSPRLASAPASPDRQAATAESQEGERQGMAGAELAAVTGRGLSPSPLRLAQAATTPAPAATLPATPIGEQRTAPTAEEAALREQGVALVPSGGRTLEFGLSYSKQTREIGTLLRADSNTTTATITGRLGLQGDLQATARLPFQYRRTRSFGSGGERSSDSYAGDLSLSLAGVGAREAVGRPTVIWTADAVLPTGPGDSGLGAGVVLSKSYDPVVLFAGLSYLYGIDTDERDVRRALARHNLGFNLGYAYAVNDSLALSGQFVGSYRTPQESFDDQLPRERESYLLQLGLTWQLGRGLFIDPSVGFGVGSGSPDMAVSANLLYNF